MLEIRNLTRRYMTRTAVDNVSLSLEPGRTYALLGPNGSGKTTLMKMVAGLTKPTSGTIEFDGTPVWRAHQGADRLHAHGELFLQLYVHRGCRPLLR